MGTTIVCGVDKSETAAAAAAEAADLASAMGATLHLVSALQANPRYQVAQEPGSGESWTIDEDDLVDQHLADLAQRHRLNGVEVSTAIVHDDPVDAIVKEATRVEADIIVVGNRRVTGAARLLGSVATGVLRSAPCHVLVAKTT